MMKKTLYIFFFLLSTLYLAQGNSPNPFEESEKDDNTIESRTSNQDNWQAHQTPLNSVGNPADPAPIDDYIPLLVLTALGMIIYIKRNNRKLQS